MDSGPEGPDGHRWVGGWRPHRKDMRQHQDMKKKKGQRERESDKDHTKASDTTLLTLSLCIHAWASDLLNKDMWSFVCTSLHKCMLLTAVSMRVCVHAVLFGCLPARVCCALTHLSHINILKGNKYILWFIFVTSAGSLELHFSSSELVPVGQLDLGRC